MKRRRGGSERGCSDAFVIILSIGGGEKGSWSESVPFIYLLFPTFLHSLSSPPHPSTFPPPPSELFLKRIIKVPVKTVMLEKAGHYPLEQPGIDQLHAAIATFVKDSVLVGK